MGSVAWHQVGEADYMLGFIVFEEMLARSSLAMPRDQITALLGQLPNMVDACTELQYVQDYPVSVCASIVLATYRLAGAFGEHSLLDNFQAEVERLRPLLGDATRD